MNSSIVASPAHHGTFKHSPPTVIYHPPSPFPANLFSFFYLGPLRSDANWVWQVCPRPRCLPACLLQKYPRNRPSDQRMETRPCSYIFGQCYRTQGGGTYEKICWGNWTGESRLVDWRNILLGLRGNGVNTTLPQRHHWLLHPALSFRLDFDSPSIPQENNSVSPALAGPSSRPNFSSASSKTQKQTQTPRASTPQTLSSSTSRSTRRLSNVDAHIVLTVA